MNKEDKETKAKETVVHGSESSSEADLEQKDGDNSKIKSGHGSVDPDLTIESKSGSEDDG